MSRLIAVWCVLLMVPAAEATQYNGSMRLDYQSTPIEGIRQGSLMQQYYLRVSDRVLFRNQVTFTGTFDHHGRQGASPADFRPRYQLLLSSYGYGGQVSYEPYTQKQAGINAEQDVSHRWRGGMYIQPERWPRFTYDFLRARRTQTTQGTGTENWDSYQAAWQPGANALALAYTHQKRTAQGRMAELVEVYHATATTEKKLPVHHRLTLGYNFDRSWSRRSSLDFNAQDQHTTSVSIIGDPLPSFNWTAQYSGRFLRVVTPTDSLGSQRPTDHLATAALNWTPVKELTAGVSRYVERAGARANQDASRSDYWQGRLTSQGRLYRQIRAMATVYRIYYTGSPEGMKYNDAYFLSLHGQPFGKVDWSTELSLGDRHGRQVDRFGGTINMFTRMQPLASAQSQIGYTALMIGTQLGSMRVSEESFNTNLQYAPTDKMGLSATGAVRRNRIARSKWGVTWTLAGTYRWPSFASASINYIQQQAPSIAPLPGTTTPVAGRPTTLLASVIITLGPATTLNTQYTHQTTTSGVESDIWGIGFSTSF